MKGACGVGLKRRRWIGLARYGQHGAQMVDHLGPRLLHCVQNMAEVAQVTANNLHLVSQITQMFSDRMPAEDHWTLLAIFNKQTHHFQTDEPRPAGNECRHEMNVSFHSCSMSPENMPVYAAYVSRQHYCLTLQLTASRPTVGFGFNQNRHRAAMRWSAMILIQASSAAMCSGK